MAERFDLRHSDECDASHRQCDVEPGAFARRHHGAQYYEQLWQRGFYLQLPLSTSKTVSIRATTTTSTKEEVTPDPLRGLAMRQTNIIPDVMSCELPMDNRRSPGYRRIEPHMAGQQFYMWIGQHETGRYSKAHAHGSAAVLICLSGKGYTYTWPAKLGTHPWEKGTTEEIRRQDYEPVGMVSAAPMSGNWFHAHFGAEQRAPASHRLVRPQRARTRSRQASVKRASTTAPST